MSIENFVKSLRAQIKDLDHQRQSATGGTRGGLTRKINALQAAITKATRKGVTE